MNNQQLFKILLVFLMFIFTPFLSNSNLLFSQGDCKVTFCTCCQDSTNYQVFTIDGTLIGGFNTGEEGGCSVFGVLNAYSLLTYYVEETNPNCDSWSRVYFTACVCLDDSMTVKLPCCGANDNNDKMNLKNYIKDPKEFLLKQNYPNPFNPVTQIGFYLPVESFTVITIYDVNGRIVDVPLQANLPAGYNEFVWNANNQNLASGIYFYKLEAGDFSDEKKMILIK